MTDKIKKTEVFAGLKSVIYLPSCRVSVCAHGVMRFARLMLESRRGRRAYRSTARLDRRTVVFFESLFYDSRPIRMDICNCDFKHSV